MTDETMEDGKLLPCPFCGSHDIDPKAVAFYPNGDTSTGIHHAPGCMVCGSMGGNTIAAWNTRASSSALALAQGALRKLAVFLDQLRPFLESKALPSSMARFDLEREEVRLVLDAITSAAPGDLARVTPEGWRLVPVEPTPETSELVKELRLLRKRVDDFYLKGKFGEAADAIEFLLQHNEQLMQERTAIGMQNLALVDRAEKAERSIETLTRQLPKGMKHCTILFKECEKGHGWLTATNWIQHGCPTCRAETSALVERLRHCADDDAHSVDDMRAAAVAIETLTRERDEARLERHYIAEKYKFFADACEKAEAQVETIRNETVEACANWHEKQAARLRSKITGMTKTWASDRYELDAKYHEACASELRALSTSDKPGQESEQLRQIEDVPSLHGVVLDHFKNGGK